MGPLFFVAVLAAISNIRKHSNNRFGRCGNLIQVQGKTLYSDNLEQSLASKLRHRKRVRSDRQRQEDLLSRRGYYQRAVLHARLLRCSLSVPRFRKKISCFSGTKKRVVKVRDWGVMLPPTVVHGFAECCLLQSFNPHFRTFAYRVHHGCTGVLR